MHTLALSFSYFCGEGSVFEMFSSPCIIFLASDILLLFVVLVSFRPEVFPQVSGDVGLFDQRARHVTPALQLCSVIPRPESLVQSLCRAYI